MVLLSFIFQSTKITLPSNRMIICPITTENIQSTIYTTWEITKLLNHLSRYLSRPCIYFILSFLLQEEVGDFCRITMN